MTMYNVPRYEAMRILINPHVLQYQTVDQYLKGHPCPQLSADRDWVTGHYDLVRVVAYKGGEPVRDGAAGMLQLALDRVNTGASNPVDIVLPEPAVAVEIEINPHLILCQSVACWLANNEELAEDAGDYDWLSFRDYRDIVRLQHIVQVTWYPNSPVGHCDATAATLERACTLACHKKV